MADGLAALRANRPGDANVAFDRALKLDPRDPLLNFLNGFAYQSGAGGAGDRQDLARVGYQLALQFDPNFWPAAQQLGYLALQNGDVHAAQLAFAKAVMLAPERATPLYGLAAASYAAADLATARAAFDRAAALEAPDTPDRLRVGAMVRAATGDAAGAKSMLASLQSDGDPASAFTANRVQTLDRNYEQLAQLFTLPPPKPSEAIGSDGPPPATAASAAIPPLTAEPKRMANIDVAIIEREETAGTLRGVNLLDGLTIQFGDSLIDAASSKVGEPGQITSNTKTNNHALTLSIPGITYSMNIANSTDGFSRLQAHPTLLAFDGQTSKYFNGGEIFVATDGALSSSSFTLPYGLTLSVTPVFGANDTVNLHVYAELSAPQSGKAPGSFAQSVDVAKVSTDVAAAMTYGQTLVISGGTSSSETRSSSGVPVLRDIPGVQNLFSRKTDSTEESSLLMLLTLRRSTAPQDRWTASGPFGTPDGDPNALAMLKDRYGAWFALPPSLAETLARISSRGDGNSFRAGDVRLSDPAGAGRGMDDGKARNRFLDDVMTLFYY